MVPLLRFWKRRFGPQKEWYAVVESLFGIVPDNIELYKLALLHRSASVFLDDGTPINNERLEFLGDAVLEAVVSDWLFIEFPDRDEGFLTQLRQKVVSRVSLNQLAEDIGLAGHVIYSDGNNGKNMRNLYGDALEAMIGAMYLDKGYDFTNGHLIDRVFRKHIDIGRLSCEEIDFKSRLIEWCQKSRRTIVFHTDNGPGFISHNPVFVSRIEIDGIEMARGDGKSKKEAEQRAAYLLSGLIIPDANSDKLLEMMDGE